MKRAISLFILLSFAGFVTPCFADAVQDVLSQGTIVRIWDSTAYPAAGFPTITPPLPDPSIPSPPATLIDEVNYICAQWDSNIVNETVPFNTVGTPAYEMIPNQTLHLVRLISAGGSVAGAWLMPAESVRGLTPAELRDRFALPSPPIRIVMADLPRTLPSGKNVALWVGTAGAINTPTYPWGFGGGPQLRIISDFGTNYFPNYGWPGSAYYYHVQDIGTFALSYAPLAGGGNAGQLASYLDSYIPTDYTDLGNVYAALDFLNYVGFGADPLQDALNQLSGSRFDALNRVEMRNALLFGNTLLDRSYLLQRAICCNPGCCGCPCPCICPGLWCQGIGEFGNERKEDDLFGFTYQTGGIVVGADTSLLPSLIVGWSAGYLGTHMKWENNGGSAHIDNGRFGLYASYFPGCTFYDAVLCFGMNRSHTNRHIEFADDFFLGVDRTALANESGHDVEFHLDGGTYINCYGFLLTPLARLSYFNIKENLFNETGADSIDLFVDDFGAETLRSHLELGLSKCYEFSCCLKIIPQIQVAWAHDFPLDDRPINYFLSEIGETVTVYGFRGHTNSLIAGGELIFLTARGILFSGRYDVEARNHFTAQEASLHLRYNF